MNPLGEIGRIPRKKSKMRTLVLCNLLIHTISPHKSRGPERHYSRLPLYVSIVLPGGQGEHAKTAVTTHFVTYRCDFRQASAWLAASPPGPREQSCHSDLDLTL